MTSGRMSLPEDVKMRVNVEEFRLFPFHDISVYIHEALLDESTIDFIIPHLGEFRIELHADQR